jgi:hypothetical protein
MTQNFWYILMIGESIGLVHTKGMDTDIFQWKRDKLGVCLSQTMDITNTYLNNMQNAEVF